MSEMKFKEGKRYLIRLVVADDSSALPVITEVTILEVTKKEEYVKMQFPSAAKWVSIEDWDIIEELKDK